MKISIIVFFVQSQGSDGKGLLLMDDKMIIFAPPSFHPKETQSLRFISVKATQRLYGIVRLAFAGNLKWKRTHL